MTQQPYAPQYPQAPQQGYGQLAPAPYAAPPQQPYQQPYPPQYGQPPAPQQQPLAQGSLSDYYSQPTSGGGPSLAWSKNNGTVQFPLGTTYVGVVARDVVDGDVQQDTDPKTGQGKSYRDGRPRWVMKVPLKNVAVSYQGGQPPQPNPQEFPEGEAQWFVRGQARDELTRAGNAAGLTGQWAPREGDVILVQLIERRPSRGGGMPQNIVTVSYQPGPRHQVGGQAAAPAPAPATEASSPASVPASHEQAQAPMAPPAAPVQQPGDFAQQQVAAYAQQPAQYPPSVDQQIAQQGPPPQWAQPAQQPAQVPGQPVPGQAAPGQPPASIQQLSPAQQGLYQRITGGQPQG